MKFVVLIALVGIFGIPASVLADLPPGGVTMIAKGDEVSEDDSEMPRTIDDPEQGSITDILLPKRDQLTPHSTFKYAFKTFFHRFFAYWPDLFSEYVDPLWGWYQYE